MLAAKVEFLFNGGSRKVIILSFKNTLYANPISLNDAEFFGERLCSHLQINAHEQTKKSHLKGDDISMYAFKKRCLGKRNNLKVKNCKTSQLQRERATYITYLHTLLLKASYLSSH